MRKRKKRRYYARSCMAAIAVAAVLTFGAGFVLRRTLLKGLPQYDSAPDIAIPLMLLQDSGPLREARARAEWEAARREQAAESPAAVQAFAAEPVVTLEPVDTQAPTTEPSAATRAPAAEPVVTLAPVATEILTPEPVAATQAPAAQPVITLEPVATEILTPEPTAAPTPKPTAAPTPEPMPVAVDRARPTESYFDHTLFIGDSRTDGMRMWARLGEAQYFCGTNYSVYNLFNRRTSDREFKDATLDEVLAEGSYDQIYLLLGYNECGYDYEDLMGQFRYVIARVREAQPQARLILHGIMHASARVAAQYSYYTVEHIEKINDGLRALADEMDGVYFVDCNAPFCDAKGFLLGSVSTDGEHLTPEYTAQWAQEILRQAIVE